MTAIVPLRGRALAALRAVAGATRGLRLGAFPSAMALLANMGLVEKRSASLEAHPKGVAWFLTDQGRELVRIYGRDEA